MSLSDIDNERFKPMALSSLESFDEEHSNKTDQVDPDFDRFKALFETPKFENEESYEFKTMYDTKKGAENIVFTPLIKRKDESSKKETLDKGREGLEGKGSSEEKGYREGVEKGLEKGIAQGKNQGYEEGFKKGEAEGFEKGEQRGDEKGQQQGFEQGFKAGEEKATLQTREKAVEVLNSLEQSLKTADDILVLLVEKYEERIISLIQQIAKKVVMAQVEINDEIIKHMILDALKTLVKPEKVVLSVSLDDYEYIEMIKDEFFEQIDSLNSVSVRSDPSIKRGGCKIDTITASVSADAESRLEAIFEAIKTAGAA